MADDPRERWRSWLHPQARLPDWQRNLWDEFHALGLRRDSWHGFDHMLKASSEEAQQRARSLRQVVLRNHIEAQAMAFRRLGDEGTHPNIVSFGRLLTEIGNETEVLGDALSVRAQDDLTLLRNTIAPIKTFADKYVAHLDRDHGTAVPQVGLDDMDAAIDLIGEMWVRWFINVTGEGTTSWTAGVFPWWNVLRLEYHPVPTSSDNM